jgi:hypothetical protein
LAYVYAGELEVRPPGAPTTNPSAASREALRRAGFSAHYERCAMAKFYALTRSGRRHLEQETEEWRRLSSAISRVIRLTEA